MRGRSQTSTPASSLTAATDARRVVVRYADGGTLRGYFSDEVSTNPAGYATESLSVRNMSGETQQVDVSQLKAIFFVKSFEGSRDYSEFKVFTHQPGGKGVWVRVHFQDGEVMEGIVPNSLTTFAGKILSLTPPDPQSNNDAVLVSKSCLKEMQILGLASD